MAHRPIAIDGAGADGSSEGAGGVEPCSSKDHGGDGACIDQVVVPTAPPRPSAGGKDAVYHRVVNERRLPKPPKSQHLSVERFYGVHEGGPSRLHTMYVSGAYAR